METLFLGCFVFGLLFTLVTLAMGASHGALDGLGIHGHGAHGAPDVGVDHSWLGQINLSALMAFLTWFGGAGWLTLHYGPAGVLGTALGTGAGLVAGVGAYALVAWFISKLRAGETVARPEDYVLEGTVARVTVPASAGGVGEIVFTLAGVRRVEGARAADGRTLVKGEEVVITGYERGVAIVEDAQQFIHGSASREPGALSEPQRPPLAPPEREAES